MFDIKPFLRKLEDPARKRAERAGVRAVDHFGEHVLGESQRVCPVDTGALQNSATSESVKRTGRNITKVIGFNTDYAAAVHERLDQHHNQGQAKYLETTMHEQGPKLAPFVEREMKKAL